MPVLDPEYCEHRVEWLTTHGSNQFYDRVKCSACLTVLQKEPTAWWTEEQERRRLAKLEKPKSTKKQYDNAKSDSQIPTESEQLSSSSRPSVVTQQKIDIARLRERRREHGSPDWD